MEFDMLILMNLLKQAKKLVTPAISTILLVACGIAAPAPTITATTVPSITPSTPSITPSPIPTTTSSPTNTLTATPELGIAPNCKIANEEGQLYLLSDQEFRDLRTTPGKLDQVLTINYPEWAN